jgi:hypothetical protein
MEELGSFIVYLVMGLFFWSLTKSLIRYMMVTKLQESFKDVLERLIHEVNVEQHGAESYWFDKETNEFLAQGKTDDELIERIKKRFPDHIFIVPEKGLLASPEWVFKQDANIVELSRIVKL